MNCIIDAWQKYELELSGYLIKRLKNKEQAEELLQDTFLKAICLAAKFCELDNPRAWLYHVAKNEIIDLLRKNQVSINVSYITIEELENIETSQQEPIAVANLSHCLPLALEQLTADEKHIISRCDIEGMTQRAFAAQFDLTLPAAKSKIQRARRQLRKQLEAQCQIVFDPQDKVCCFTPATKEKN